MSRRQLRHIIFWSIWLCGGVLQGVQAQDLSNLKEKKPVKVSGGFNFSQIGYTAIGMEDRRDPYTYYANGNLTFDLYGLSVPFSFNFSNQQFAFQQPFNQYGISPTYEWATLHLGYSSMNFSPYTLSGHTFLGAGIELDPPGKFQVSAMYGRLQKAIEPDTTGGNISQYAFKRMGYGAKVGYGEAGNLVEVSFFKSKDDPNSISFIPDSTDILPEENLAIGINVSKTFLERFNLQVNYGTSALTRDTRSPQTSREQFALAPKHGLFEHRLSTGYYHAIKTNLAYNGNSYTIGLGYERVDPGYETHGAYYFNNDLENTTVNAATRLLDQKLSVNVNAGLQRNNLNNQELSQMKRFVGALNVNYTVSQKLMLSGSYSNFQTYTNIRSQFDYINQTTPLDNLDTLNYTQISQNSSLNVNYSLGKSKQKAQSLNANFSYQQSDDKQGGVAQNSGSKFYNTNLGYSMQQREAGWSFNVSINASRQESALSKSTTLGPVAAFNKTLLDKKLRMSLSSAFNAAFRNGKAGNQVLNVRANGNYNINKHHHVNLALAFINRKDLSNTSGTSADNANTAFSELTGTLTYSYNF